MPTVVQVAANLLTAAAGFCRDLGEANPQLTTAMQEIAHIFIELAELLGNDPHGQWEGVDAVVAARGVLEATADFLERYAAENPDLADVMQGNADTYRMAVAALADDPFRMIPEKGP